MSTNVHRERLVSDLKAVLHDTEDLLKATANDVGEKATVARTKLNKTIDQAKVKLGEVEESLRDKGKEAVKVTDTYVQDNPWQAVGIAAALGLLLGLAVSRR